MPLPQSPIAAVTHPDPYPYYAALVAERPVYRDDALGLWVVFSADAVRAALTHECCRVRPPAEPVPPALLGSPAGDVFRHLVRMTDGAGHCPLKRAVSATLDSIDEPRAAELSAEWARQLAGELEPGTRPRGLPEYAFRLPVYVVGSLLGVPREHLHQTALWVDDFVRCLAPASSPEQVARGKDAAAHLLDTLRHLLPPVQNTRRFLARDAVVAGHQMREGDAILVVLAAANRDPSANVSPERFDPARESRLSFTFGVGPHACPGERLAVTIAQAGVAHLLEAGPMPERVGESVGYRPSANARVPLLDGSRGGVRWQRHAAQPSIARSHGGVR